MRVAGECRGLPIALTAVARALGDKDLAEWNSAAQRLMKSQPANPDDNREAFECIKLSYDYLRNKDYKSYFLLCCLFPEDYEIPVKDLFTYAIGKGLFRDADTLKEAREMADSVVTHLQHSCLLLEGGDRSRYVESTVSNKVKMHDVVRDTAIQIAQSEGGFLVKAGCGLKDWPRQMHGGYYSAVSLMENDLHKLPEKLVYPKLQVLLLNNSSSIEKLPETFFPCPNELRVLDISYNKFSLLPQSFSLLIHLRALHLNYWNSTPKLIDISMIGKLKKLEILTVRYSRLKMFSRAIGGLTNLKILDMTGATIDVLASTVIPKLQNLEELCMYGQKVLHPRIGEGEGELSQVGFDVVTSLSKLRVLEVIISDERCSDLGFYPNWVEFDIRIGTARQMMRASDLYDKSISLKSISLKLDTISR